MPKPIKIMVTVEETAFGAFFNKIESMPGVIEFAPMGTDHTAEEPAGPVRRRVIGPKPTTAKGELQSAVIDILTTNGGVCTTEYIGAELARRGLRAKSMYAVLSRLVKSKTVVRSGEYMNYSYTIKKKG